MAVKTWQDIEPIVQQAGGLEVMFRNLEAHERVMQHFWANKTAYLEEYPRKWIVVTIDGVAAICDELEEAVETGRQLANDGIARHIQNMDPEPQSWLL